MKFPQTRMSEGALKWFLNNQETDHLSEAESAVFYVHLSRALCSLEQAQSIVERATMEQMK